MPITKTNSFNGSLLSTISDFGGAVKKRTSGSSISVSSVSKSLGVAVGSSKRRSTAKSTTSSAAAAAAPTELCLDDFHDFLTQKLSKVEGIESMKTTLAPLHRCLDQDDMSDFFNEMEHCLQALLNKNESTTVTLPTPIVAQLHTYLGLLYLEQNNNNSAVDALMRALWFISRTPNDTMAIALGNHRLGMAYARRTEYQQALGLLDRAIEGYAVATDSAKSVGVDYYMMAKEDRHSLLEAQQLEAVLNGKNASRYTIRKDIINSSSSAHGESSTANKGSGRVSRKDRRRSGMNNRQRSPLPTLARQGTAPARVQRSNTSGSIGIGGLRQLRSTATNFNAVAAAANATVVRRQSTAPPTMA